MERSTKEDIMVMETDKASIKRSVSAEDLELIEAFHRAPAELQDGLKRVLEAYKYRFEGKLVK